MSSACCRRSWRATRSSTAVSPFSAARSRPPEFAGEERMTRAFHDKQIAIDSTEYSLWDREVLQEMKDGGLTAVNVTLVIWENARETLDIIGQWHQRFKDHADLIMPVRSGRDILEAKRSGKVGIIFTAQNASMFEDDLYLVSVFN